MHTPSSKKLHALIKNKILASIEPLGFAGFFETGGVGNPQKQRAHYKAPLLYCQ
jgi:hypothetical protein